MFGIILISKNNDAKYDEAGKDSAYEGNQDIILDYSMSRLLHLINQPDTLIAINKTIIATLVYIIFL
ncbi:MAG: hypothetical protein LBS40_08805 [Burkholderiales bacterium]|jgi:hypothetical protein|nr:hypothetical protein [Burkholderiales bacterium]